MAAPKPVVLVILDGWGERAEATGNAVALARTPVFDRIRADGPFTTLAASGSAVGLPDDQFGNSEVGHLTIGAGRTLPMDLPRINAAIASGAFARSPTLDAVAASIRANCGRAHVAGLASTGGVHAHLVQLAETARQFAARGVPVCLHLFADGRDVPPGSAPADLANLRTQLDSQVSVSLATITGRYYAMDRDRRWERTERAWRAIAAGDGRQAADAAATFAAAEAQGETDEFIRPTVLGAYGGFQEGDGLVLCNFRADRIRQLLQAVADPAFTEFAVADAPHLQTVATMTPVSAALDPALQILFPAEPAAATLGMHLSSLGRLQLRIAETEKYPHVTYFLNGGREQPGPGEERFLAPSPRVATYDLAPAMAARLVGDRLVEAIAAAEHDLVVVNFANPDMVGHTGDLAATIRAVEAVDTELGRMVASLRGGRGVALVTADHGNAETMIDAATGGPHTAHTSVPVPLLLTGNVPARGTALRNGGSLADIAPTLLELLAIAPPPEMTGQSLLAGAAGCVRASPPI